MTDYSDVDKQDDLHILHSMGYAQELERRMSSFSNFAISFSIICILSGGINSLAQATSGAGGAAIGLGWPLGCAISGVFALAMAQIASAYPTAGGLYHWGSILGNRFTGWVTAWFNLIGLVTVLGAINVGTWGFFSGSIAPWFGMNVDTATAGGFANQIIFVGVITALQALVNHLGIKLTAKLTDMSGYLIFITAIVLTIVCLFGAKSWDVSRIWTFTNYSGTPEGDASVWPHTGSMWYIFALSLLLPIYTITGYDASAHTSEETIKASESVPKGMISSVFWASLFGYIMLLAFLLAIPDMNEAAKQGWNVFFWTLNSVTNPVIANIIYLAIFVAQLICGLATVTSVSRMIFAFSRDGGLPMSKALASVSSKYRTPAVAIWVGAAFSVLFVWGASLVTIGGASAYTIVVSCTVIFLFLSFAIPIVLGMKVIGTAKWPKMGPWNMGIVTYRFVGCLVVLAMVAIFIIGVQPPNQWALYITVGFLALTAIIWVLFEQRRFKGPPIGDEVIKRQMEIAAAEKAIGKA